MNDTTTDNQTHQLISSLEHIYQLKTIPRSGWVQAGIEEVGVESIAAHSYGMSILIMHLRSEIQAAGVSVERALNMALVHDIAESIVGDLTPQDNVLESVKYQAEAAAFEQIVRGVRQGDYFRDLWEDFEAVKSPEAKLVKRIDKLDMLIQAYLYEKKYEIRLDSFWKNMDDMFQGSESESIYTYISSNRFELKGNEA
ncbi:MAG: HD domain-containing protein [Candidatus Marinimicrobia bacterium]|jgi:putative hydrolase of HD superfamily|nr:HD domain-containing protein [Candidatus Neomarinimicrobiota bacterium]MBT3575112.1 HD domain-containing protein [Candidatus Neomarinimicrobiota bacterium]MBT3678884.1 HD domain-containing protein [Candidatus Neomarinimicrobiota bacterium]MBT3949998.1 HD domain-containing protein [Candidatus Neomarinimicrobiota bacterium]MBT4252701.1 HD domain-containing protein [Candidatus Neomarinimicrobiota bacterium]